MRSELEEYYAEGNLHILTHFQHISSVHRDRRVNLVEQIFLRLITCRAKSKEEDKNRQNLFLKYFSSVLMNFVIFKIRSVIFTFPRVMFCFVSG